MNSAGIIRKWRTEHGLSQHEAANKLGVSQAYYSKVELGKRAIDPDKVPDWADKMGLDDAGRSGFIDMATAVTIPDWILADIRQLRATNCKLVDLVAHRSDDPLPLPRDRAMDADQRLAELTNLRSVNRALLDRLEVAEGRAKRKKLVGVDLIPEPDA